ncbi:MAG: tetratricopeptide repeat protein [Thiohalospira sp.]
MFPIPPSVAEEAADDGAGTAFEKAMGAFRSGDYAQARTWFRRAAEAGLDTPQLTYNLGVTAFRLERYDEAEAAFRRLIDEADWAAVALYNLGLIAERRQRSERAAGFFRRVLREDATEELSYLATLGLERVGEGAGTAAEPERSRVSGFVSLGVGHDSNPGLFSGEETVERGDGDAFGDLFATGRLELGERGYLDVSGYDRRYADGGDFALQGLHIAPGVSWADEDWRGTAAISFGHDRFGGEAYRDTLTVRGEGRIERSAGGTLRLAARLRRIDAVPAYAHLDGWQLRLEGELEQRLLGGRARIGYRLEENRREDWTDGVDSADYSPQRHSLLVGADWSVSSAWWVRAELEYQHSRHPSVEVVNGESQGRRVDDRLGGLLRAGTSLPGDEWDLFAELSASEQRSTLPGYAYERARLMAGVERGW